MARLISHKKKNEEIEVTLKVSKIQYEILKEAEDDLLILPACNDCMEFQLTTGKIGNGNRIMMPNKILQRNEIKILLKKLPSRIHHIDGRKVLMCIMADEQPGVPNFGEQDG